MKHVTIIATSLSEESKSQTLAALLEQELSGREVACERVDLRELSLPFAGSAGAWESEEVGQLREAVERASHIVMAVPIYCYDANAVAKNVIELVGRAFTKKVVSFVCSAGGNNSYMAIMGFANHLMLDFRSVIVPRFLYVSPAGWEEDGTLKTDMQERLQRLVDDMGEIQVTVKE